MILYKVTILAFLTVAVITKIACDSNIQIPDFSKKLKCDYKDNNDAVLGIKAAKTQKCRDNIETAACYYKNLFATTDRFDVPRVENTCPLMNRRNMTLLCQIRPDDLSYQINKHNLTYALMVPSPLMNIQLCRDICLTMHGAPYLAYSASAQCLCLRNITKTVLERNALGKKNHICAEKKEPNTFNIFTTGYFEANNETKPYEPSPSRFDSIKSFRELKQLPRQKNRKTITEEEQGVATRKFNRIIFFFTVYQRTYRHIVRLFKALYDESHFYYFHIDARSKYLRVKMGEFMAKLEEKNVENVKIASWSMAPIWGGSSLLSVHFKAFQDVLYYKKLGLWDWDYIMNLSEADFPIRSIEEMTLHLGKFKEEQSFLSFEINEHSTKNATDGFGLNRFFLECEERMWLISERRIPVGYRIDVGPEWFWFHHTFVDYMVNSDDDYLVQLKKFYKHAVMAPESFYPSVLLSSPFCTNYVGRSFIEVSFGEREEDCQCHGKVVDWCGCSPPYFRLEKWPVIEYAFKEPKLMARKFDPRMGLNIINKLDQTINGNYSQDFKSLDSFWLNTYQSGIDKLYYADSNQRNLFDRYFGHTLNFIHKTANMTIDQDTKPSLNQVHSYFKSDEFKGFLLNFNLTLTENGEKKLVDFEVYLKSRTNDHIKSTINHNSNPRYNQMGYFNSTSSPKLHYDTFFEHFSNIEVSTDFERRERRANNYAGLIDRKSHPFVILNFDGKIWSNITFMVHWINPEGKMVKLNGSTISTPLKKNYTYFQDHLLPEKAQENLQTGVWHVRVVVESFNNLTRQATEQVLLVEEFLVTPTYDELIDNVSSLAENKYRSLLNEFWSLESICVANRDPSIKNKALRRMNRCEVDSEWSSFYPDPKSELNDGPISHNRLREYAEYQARLDLNT